MCPQNYQNKQVGRLKAMDSNTEKRILLSNEAKWFNISEPKFKHGRLYKFTYTTDWYAPFRVAVDPCEDVTSGGPGIEVPLDSTLLYLGIENFTCMRHLTNDSCSCTSEDSWLLSNDERMTCYKFLYDDTFVYMIRKFEEFYGAYEVELG